MDKVTIPVSKYQEMMWKVTRYEALRNMIKSEIKKGNKYPVKDELVLTLIDLNDYKIEMEKKAMDAV